MKQFTNLGFNNWINTSEISVVQTPNSAPAVRYIQEARSHNSLVDVTQGRKVKSILVLKSGTVIVSAIAPDTIISRIEGLNSTSGSKSERKVRKEV